MHSDVPLIVFGLLLSQLHILPCHAATDTISPGQALAGSDKLVSSGGKFALGFFQTGSKSSDGTPNWYLGIWFNTVPKFTPVWVANGGNPVADLASCKLVVFHDGNLVILHQATDQSVVWSSKANITTNSTLAVLLDTGNLVLRSTSNSSNIFWQSFDYPTNTVLPGAKISWNNATGLSRRLVSRKNTIDQAPGMYSFGFYVHNGSTSLISTFNSSNQYWSSGECTGRYYSKIPETVAASGWSGGSGIRLARRFCTYEERDDRALEEEAKKKFGWILKMFFLRTAGVVGYQFFLNMGDNLLQRSISLLHVKGPLFKRMGASHLACFAVDDKEIQMVTPTCVSFVEKLHCYLRNGFMRSRVTHGNWSTMLWLDCCRIMT